MENILQKAETKAVSKLKEKLSKFSDSKSFSKTPARKIEKTKEGENPFAKFKEML